MSYWDNHGWWFLLGCIFWPRLIVAIVAMQYWNTNPFMVVCAWLLCFADVKPSRFTKDDED